MRSLSRHTVQSKSSGGGLDPSTEPSAFTRVYDIKDLKQTIPVGLDIKSWETTGEGPSGLDSKSLRREVTAAPLTKVEIIPSDSTSKPKHIYVNISLQNINTTIGIPAQYQIDFDQPYLKEAEKYYLTIAKGVFPTLSLPLFKFVPYTVTMPQYYVSIVTPFNPIGYIVPLEPKGINTVLRNSKNQFIVYYYQQFLDMLNNAIMSAFRSLLSAELSFGGSVPPYIILNKDDNRFSLIAQKGYWAPEVYGGAKLYVDYTTWRLFNSLPSTAPIERTTLQFNIASTIPSGGGGGDFSSGINPLMEGLMNTTIDYTWSPLLTYSPGDIISYPGYDRFGNLIAGSQYYASRVIMNTGNTPPLGSNAFWQNQGSTVLVGPTPILWQAGISYVIGQIVYYPNANTVPFISLIDPNLGNVPDPSITTAAWKPLQSGNPTIWSQLVTYSINQNVWYPSVGPGGVIYRSLTNGNIGIPPGTSVTGLANWIISDTFNSFNITGSYSTLPIWSDIESIVIQTGSLPIRAEIFPPPGTDGTTLESGTQVPRPVLTDLDIIKTGEGFDRTPILYVPPGNYRIIDLFNRDELKRIDSYIQVKYKDLTFEDLTLLPGDYFTIKYIFIRNDAFSVV